MDMTTMSHEEIEGRLNAHRELMIDFVAALLGGEESIREFGRRLSEDTTLRDNEEDPGAVPDLGFAIENSAAQEIRSIMEAARARASAEKRQARHHSDRV